LNTLLLIPHANVKDESIKRTRALAFIQSHQSPEGGLGLSDELIRDYPTYATAIRLQVFANLDGQKETATKLAAYLRSQQFSGDRHNLCAERADRSAMRSRNRRLQCFFVRDGLRSMSC